MFRVWKNAYSLEEILETSNLSDEKLFNLDGRDGWQSCYHDLRVGEQPEIHRNIGNTIDN